jgi:hypothetical protein
MNAIAVMLALVAADPVAAPPAAGTISVEPVAGEGELGASRPTIVGAVGQAFASRGFTTLDQPGHSRLVADLSVRRDTVGTAPVAVAKTGSDFLPGASAGVGAGVTFGLPTAKSRNAPLERTRMEIRIRRQGDPTVMWQGSAMTVRPAGTHLGADTTVAKDLSEALLRDYPAQPEAVLSIP